MNHTVFILARDNSLICKRPDDGRICVCSLEGITNMPNIPFYHHLWDNSNQYKVAFMNLYKSQLSKGALTAKIVKPLMTIALPEDAVTVDEKILVEFFMLCGAREVSKVKECMLLTNTANAYVAVTQTCRMTVLRYVKGAVIQNTLYIANRDYTAEELKSQIRSLHNDCEYGSLPVYLNGDNLMKYSELGLVVKPEEMLNNFTVAEKKVGNTYSH